MVGKQAKIDCLYKRKRDEIHDTAVEVNEDENEIEIMSKLDDPQSKSQRVESEEVGNATIERDPGKRKQIWEYPSEQRNTIRRAYLQMGPCQPKLSQYKKSGQLSHRRCFQPSWFVLFPSWLEYSSEVDASFCLHCFLFNKPDGHPALRAFTVDGFRNWKKVRNGKKCAFLIHMGINDPNSTHNLNVQACGDLLRQETHLPHVLMKQTKQQVKDNRLRLKASIKGVLYLALQGSAMRGHDESKDSTNRGNFIELIELIAYFDKEVAKVVLENAPKNASYLSPDTQKEILEVVAQKVKWEIREEIGESKYCILVDESCDMSRKEQMAIVLRYVDKFGLVRERFFGLVHVANTSSLTLKNGICSMLSDYHFDLMNIRGQGYDGANNMRGEWNGLQALISNECPYAYYIHCFAHRLQLALVAASKEVILVYQFFSKLTCIVSFVLGSSKRSDELQAAYANEITLLIENGELETGTGLNQHGNLQRPTDTRWSSHLKSICSLLKMFSPTCIVLRKIIDEGRTSSQRGEAQSSLDSMATFEFVFVLHLMKEVMAVTDALCQALQRKAQDILNALHLVSSTKDLIQNLRNTGWEILLAKVISFCESRSINVPNMSSNFVGRRGRARNQKDIISVEHHYRMDIFNEVIDFQLQELNERFNDKAVELLTLSSALDPRQARKSFRIDDICKLVDKFYPMDFTSVEKEILRVQLQHFESVIKKNPEFQKLSSISDMCQWMVDTEKSFIYPLLLSLLKLVLTLPVSTATTERAFSAMKTLKTKLRNKMEDDFLEHCMIIFIEREMVKRIKTDSIIDGFRDMKERRVLL